MSNFDVIKNLTLSLFRASHMIHRAYCFDVRASHVMHKSYVF